MKNIFKKLLATGTAAVLVLTGCSLSSATSSMEASAAGTMTAWEITKNMQIGWNIGNTLDATGSDETSWGNPRITQQLIDTVKAKGFNTIRIPTTWYQHITTSYDSNGNKVYTIAQDYLARVKEVIDYCYKDDMYVILNIHHEEWINRSDFSTAYDEMSTELKQVWTQIATYFADYDQHLVFEGMNEPRAKGTTIEWTGDSSCYEVINKLDQDFVDTVRSISGPYQDTRLLMCPDYCASGYSYVYGSFDVPDDDYVAVSLHAYSPYEFAMGNGDHTTFSSAYESSLDSLFSDMQSYFTDKGIPIVLGEFSTSNYNNTDARCDWATYYITWAKKLGIPCVLWDNNCISNSSDASEAHGYLNRSSLTWYEQSEPVVDAMMDVINDSSVVWGSESTLPTYSHADINSGDIIYSNASGCNLTSASGSNCTPAANLSASQISTDREIAVKYTGSSAPILAVCDSSWDNWTEVSPYSIDTDKGIAYFSTEAIQKACTGWDSGNLSNIAHLFIRAGSTMTVYTVASISAASVDATVTTTEPATTTTTKASTTAVITSGTTTVSETETTSSEAKEFETAIYTLKDLTPGSTLTVSLEGTPGASTGGCFGYVDATDPDANETGWVSKEWSDNYDSDGKITVTFTVPDGVTGGEFQIWWAGLWNPTTESNDYADSVMVEYSCDGASAVTTTTEATTTTTTTVTTTTAAAVTTTAPTSSEPASEDNVFYGDMDLNGTVDMSDLVVMNKIVSNTITPNAAQKANADLNADGMCDGSDALILLRYNVHTISVLPYVG